MKDLLKDCEVDLKRADRDCKRSQNALIFLAIYLVIMAIVGFSVNNYPLAGLSCGLLIGNAIIHFTNPHRR